MNIGSFTILFINLNKGFLSIKKVKYKITSKKLVFYNTKIKKYIIKLI